MLFPKTGVVALEIAVCHFRRMVPVFRQYNDAEQLPEAGDGRITRDFPKVEDPRKRNGKKHDGFEMLMTAFSEC